MDVVVAARFDYQGPDYPYSFATNIPVTVVESLPTLSAAGFDVAMLMLGLIGAMRLRRTSAMGNGLRQVRIALESAMTAARPPRRHRERTQ